MRGEMKRLEAAGWQALESGDCAHARDLYLAALAIAQQLGDTHAQTNLLSCLGMAYRSLEESAEAQKVLQESADAASCHGLVQNEATARYLLGELLRSQGQHCQAVTQLLRAVEASMQCENAAGVEKALGKLGLVYLERGWAEQAAECFRQSLELCADPLDRPVWLGNLGQALDQLGQSDEAIAYYEKAHQAAVASSDITAQALALGSKGATLYEQGQIDEAEECFQAALGLARQANDRFHEGIWLANLGNAFRKRGQFDVALSYCRQALNVARQVANRHLESAHLDSIGECLFDMGDWESAREKYEAALAISEEIGDRASERIYHHNLSKLLEHFGQLEEAYSHLARAADLFDEQRARVKSDELKTTIAERGQVLYADLVRVCLSLGKRIEALEFVGRAKARAILDLLRNSPIDISQIVAGDDDALVRLIERESRLREQIDHLERLVLKGPPADSGHRGAAQSPDQTRNLYREWREVVNQLRARHANYASLVSVPTLSFKEMSSLWQRRGEAPGHLQGNTAVIEYFWTDDYLFAAAIWQGCRQPAVHLVTDRDAMDRLQADICDFLEMSATEGWEVPVSLCRRLYEQLLHPLCEALPDKVRRLIIIPHGGLYRLPFNALHDGAGYLIEKYAVSFLPTASLIPVLAQDRKVEAGAVSYLVSAISDYSATRGDGISCGSRLRAAFGLEDLKHTMEEARRVFSLGAEHSAQSRLLTNDEVKQSLPALFGQHPVVHFAGHALFNASEPLASGLVLSDGTILSAAAILQGNVLRTNCGRLLVLSACQTGVNMVTAGGEIVGLARALMYAGMPNLILSLWEVADRSASDLMQDFHAMWRGGKEAIAQALRQAQIKAISQGQPIHAWAPFIHLGVG